MKINLKLFFILIFILNFLSRILIIDNPSFNPKDFTGLVFDEVFYARSALYLLNATSYNNEHPPLAKALSAFGFLIFGINSLGLRFFHIILGSLLPSIFFLFVFKLFKNLKISIFSTLLLCFDTLYFVHSSIAMLDVPMLFFYILSFLFLLNFFEKFDLKKIIIAAIFFGFAALCKESAFLLYFPILIFLFLKLFPNFKIFLKYISLFTSISILIFFLGLQIYDLYTQSYTNFIEHINYIITYAKSLTINEPEKFVYPWRWIVWYKPIPYYVTSTSENGKIIFRNPAYYGIHNPFLYSSLLLSFPFLFWQIFRKKKKIENESLLITWIMFGYLIFIPWSLFFKRVIYPFYILNALPAISIAFALLFKDFPSKIFFIYLIFEIFFFFVFFPVKPKTLAIFFERFLVELT
jgi:predicted membrane-bound dolichyl-phosphate-mannose-protein mannosyltransferase